jgi:hypothetical protein
MEPFRTPLAPGAPAPDANCDACGLRLADVARVTDHVEHVARVLSPLEQRQLRSHLFALLAAVTATMTATE